MKDGIAMAEFYTYLTWICVFIAFLIGLALIASYAPGEKLYKRIKAKRHERSVRQAKSLLENATSEVLTDGEVKVIVLQFLHDNGLIVSKARYGND